MYYTYVLQSIKDERWYTGCTDDLRKRFKEHNQEKVNSTKGRGPFHLIYYEACLDKHDAFTREKYLKTGMGKRYLKNRLKRFLSLTGQDQQLRSLEKQFLKEGGLTERLYSARKTRRDIRPIRPL